MEASSLNGAAVATSRVRRGGLSGFTSTLLIWLTPPSLTRPLRSAASFLGTPTILIELSILLPEPIVSTPPLQPSEMLEILEKKTNHSIRSDPSFPFFDV